MGRCQTTSDLEKDAFDKYVFQNSSKFWHKYVLSFLQIYIQKVHIQKISGNQNISMIVSHKLMTQAALMFMELSRGRFQTVPVMKRTLLK